MNTDQPDGNADAVRDLVLKEYDYHATSFWNNERLGEQRVMAFVGFVGAVTGALGIVAKVWDTSDMYLPILISLVVLLVLGRITFVRVVKRNLDTDRYKEGMAAARQFFLDQYDDEDDVDLRRYLYFDPADGPDRDPLDYGGLTTGGWLQVVAAINALLAGALALALAWGAGTTLTDDGWPMTALWAIAVLVALAAWARQVADANQRYTEKEKDVAWKGRPDAGPG